MAAPVVPVVRAAQERPVVVAPVAVVVAPVVPVAAVAVASAAVRVAVPVVPPVVAASVVTVVVAVVAVPRVPSGAPVVVRSVVGSQRSSGVKSLTTCRRRLPVA